HITTNQVQFLQSVLGGANRPRTPFLVGMHHQPMWTTSSSHSSNTTLRNAWGPIFDQYHLNVDIAGHVHSYESTYPLHGGQVVPDAQGTRYFNGGGGGAPLYDFSGNQPFIVQRESAHGYSIMHVTATNLTWTA